MASVAPLLGADARSKLREGTFAASLVGGLIDLAGIPATADASLDVEVVRRVGENASYLIGINHSAEAGSIAAAGVELSTGIRYSGIVPVAAGGVVVLREE